MQAKNDRSTTLPVLPSAAQTLNTIYMGSLFGDGIATFQAPAAGAPLVRWEY